MTFLVKSPLSCPTMFLLYFSALCLSAIAFSADFTATPTTSVLSNKKVCIAGGGPCGIYLATLLLRSDATVDITILERSERRSSNNINAFGIGLQPRLLASLESVPGLRQRVESVGAKVTSPPLSIVSRADLSEQMTRFLEEQDGRSKKRCRILFGEGCADIDLAGREVTTTSGRKVGYDLLIGADGINSIVRRTLVDQRGVQEEHYLEPSRWKALRLPPQPDIPAGSFKPLVHPLLRGGRILPRYPEGHILLLFWGDDAGAVNPGNVTSSDDLKSMLTDALQDEPRKNGLFWGLLGVGKDRDNLGRKRTVVFDQEALDLFLKTRPSRSHYMKIDRFHDDAVALVGDSAHGMNAFLGQGCACGLRDAEILAECLMDENTTDLSSALTAYTERALPGAHAVTDLNLVATLLRAGPFYKALMLPLTLFQKVRGKMLFARIGDPNIPYEQILKESRLLIALSRLRWKGERKPPGDRP